MYIGLHVKCPLFLPDFDETWIFSTDFRKKSNIKFSRKCVQWEPSCPMLTDGQTAITKLIIAFPNSATAHNGWCCSCGGGIVTEPEWRALPAVCALRQIYVAQTVAANQSMQIYGPQQNQTKDGVDIKGGWRKVEWHKGFFSPRSDTTSERF